MSKDLTKLKDELWVMQKDQKVVRDAERAEPCLLDTILTSLLPVAITGTNLRSWKDFCYQRLRRIAVVDRTIFARSTHHIGASSITYSWVAHSFLHTFARLQHRLGIPLHTQLTSLASRYPRTRHPRGSTRCN